MNFHHRISTTRINSQIFMNLSDRKLIAVNAKMKTPFGESFDFRETMKKFPSEFIVPNIAAGWRGKMIKTFAIENAENKQ
jgi:hypothetical protein